MTNTPRSATPMLAQSSYDQISDEELLLRYRRGREGTDFAELVRRYEHELFGFLRRFLGNAELAEDAFQATFLQIHLKCEQYEEGRPLKPWLYMIATNKAIDLKRKQGRLRLVSIHGGDARNESPGSQLANQLEADTLTPAAEADKAEQAARARRALDELPEHSRLVVELVYFQGLKYREAAEVLSIPVGTVKSRINAAISKLTASWEDYLGSSE